MFKVFSAIVGVSKEQIVQCPSCKGYIIEDAMMCIHCGSPVEEYQAQPEVSLASDGSSGVETQ